MLVFEESYYSAAMFSSWFLIFVFVFFRRLLLSLSDSLSLEIFDLGLRFPIRLS